MYNEMHRRLWVRAKTLCVRLPLWACGLFVAALSCSGSQRDAQFMQAQDNVDRLAEQEKYDEAIAALESMLIRHNDKLYEITRALGDLYTETQQYDKAIQIWGYGHRQGCFYLIEPRFERFAPFADIEGFEAIVAQDKRLRKKAIDSSATVYDVHVPTELEARRKYPLVIVLHGGGRTKEDAKEYWTSPMLSEEYVVVYVQSYLHYGLKEYGWAGFDPRARSDLRRCFDEVTSLDVIDTTRVLVGGISAGGMTAIDLVVNHVIPASGFLVVCPGKPTVFELEDVAGAADRGVRGVIIGGETDFYREEQELMAEAFAISGLEHQFVVIDGMGHEYPSDFEARLEEALRYLDPEVAWPASGRRDRNAVPADTARFDIRVENVMIPARDGVDLSADLYFPAGPAEDLPVILIRTPYGKENRSPAPARRFAEHGYAVAVQDVRGKGASGGRFEPLVNDAHDGYDTISWLARQAWSNGRVGTYGCSYLGENQIVLAKMKHPNHVTMIPQAAGGAVGSAGGRCRYFGIFEGGALRLDGALSWFMNAGVRNWDGSKGTCAYTDMLEYLPVREIISACGGETDWEDYLSRPLSDGGWNEIGFVSDEDTFDIPALHVNSWFDYGVSETAYLFNLLGRNSERQESSDNQFLVVSPATHCASEQATEHTVVRDLRLGDARLGYWDLYVAWYDYWLKGIENGIINMPKVQVYVMGRNVWRHESEWPLAMTRHTPFFLHSDGAAGWHVRDGSLDTSLPGGEPPDRFRYDPLNPVPSSPLACGRYRNGPAEVENRPDVLTYTSEALKEGLEVTGSVRVVLYISSSARDTDFVARLVDVAPSGRTMAIQQGILRSRFRLGFDRETRMERGEVYRVEVDLNSTSYWFAPGHRIRLEVSSSFFPYFDRNLNTGHTNFTGTTAVIARNTIYHSAEYPSHVVLPIVD